MNEGAANGGNSGGAALRIGWIGLGAIGTQMALRLLAAGHALSIYPRGAGLTQVCEAGASAQADYAKLASGSELLVACVYDDAQVRSVLLESGALAAMQPGSILAVHTTGSPALMRQLGALAPAGVQVIDATFSGGPADAGAGTLTLMVGGDEAALERVRGAFECYSARIFHVGELGHAQLVKLMNNLLLATNMMNAVQLLGMAEGLGFETTTVAQVIQASSGASFAMRLFERQPVGTMLEASRPYLVKDVAVALAAAEESGIDVGAFAATAAYFAAC